MSGGERITVVIPVFNQGVYLPTAIRSVLDQDLGGVELIVVDDGSTDETQSVIASFGDRIRTITQANAGASVALNRGIRAGRGGLVCWLSADDRFLPGKLRRQLDAFAASPGLGVSFTAARLVGERGELVKRDAIPAWRHPDAFLSIFWANPINGSTAMMRRDVFDEMGGFDETLRADVDGAMWLRCARQYAIAQIDEPLIEYRIHRNTLSANRSLMVDSMTRVRLPYLEDGTVAERAMAHDPDPPRLLATMACDFAWWGLRDVATRLLHESRSLGTARRAQVTAVVALRVTANRRATEAVRRVGGTVRRAAWRRLARRASD